MAARRRISQIGLGSICLPVFFLLLALSLFLFLVSLLELWLLAVLVCEPGFFLLLLVAFDFFLFVDLLLLALVVGVGLLSDSLKNDFAGGVLVRGRVRDGQGLRARNLG
jgi:hypothetical protein